MKIRVTLMTENDKHPLCTDEEMVDITKQTWQVFLDMVNTQAKARGDEDRAYVEKVELVKE